MDVKYTFFVDFARPQRTNELLVMQNDNLTRIGRFILMNNGSPMDMSEVDSLTVNAVLPDETRIMAEAQIVTNDDDEFTNEVLFPIPASMTSAVGKTVVTITLYNTISTSTQEIQKEISSFEFYINTRNELNKDDESGDDDYAGIRDLIARALEAVDLVEQIVAQKAMPNPYPLQVILEGNTYNYDGSVSVRIDMGSIISRISALEQAFPNGCRTIARAITAGRGTYASPVDGVSTADNAGPSTMANNIKTLANKNYTSGYNAGYPQGVSDTKAIDPTWNTDFTNKTAGAASNLQTKCTKAGWTDLNEIVASTAAKTTAQINTTGDNQIHDFSIIPGVYNKAKVNQKPAYDAGYEAGFDDATFHGYNVIWKNAGQYIRNEGQPNNRPGKELIHTLTFSKDMKYVALFKTVAGKEELMSGGTLVLHISNDASVGTHDNGELKIYKNVPAGSKFTLNMLPSDYTYYDNYSRWMGSWSEAVVELY